MGDLVPHLKLEMVSVVNLPPSHINKFGIRTLDNAEGIECNHRYNYQH